jgi:predicted TIM-barrel fold metal-dependent hydrolase
MELPFTNVHIHVFNSECAPDNFLRILPSKFVRKRPEKIKAALDSRLGRWTIETFFRATSRKKPDKRRAFGKYIAFLNVGTDASQLKVFEAALRVGQQFDPDIRLIGLTMNMDFMDTERSEQQISYETQLVKVMEIKRFYPVNFFPFLGIDPRHKKGANMVSWARSYFENGIQYTAEKNYPFFCGLKLYPALGFFPFDPALEEIFAYAEWQHLPVMTHCTRVGSQYIGNRIEDLIPQNPRMIDVPDNAVVLNVRQNINNRIQAYLDRGWVKNSEIGDNDLACDLFGHPENYIPLLEKFPRLKICLAHMGGSSEVENAMTGDLAKIREVDPISWFQHIREMMLRYPNLYTDISYTLTDFQDVNSAVYINVMNLLNEPYHNPQTGRDEQLGDRVLFGTDFFMTEQERREPELYAITRANLGQWWDRLGRVNPQRFIMQPV